MARDGGFERIERTKGFELKLRGGGKIVIGLSALAIFALEVCAYLYSNGRGPPIGPLSAENVKDIVFVFKNMVDAAAKAAIFFFSFRILLRLDFVRKLIASSSQVRDDRSVGGFDESTNKQINLGVLLRAKDLEEKLLEARAYAERRSSELDELGRELALMKTARDQTMVEHAAALLGKSQELDGLRTKNEALKELVAFNDTIFDKFYKVFEDVRREREETSFRRHPPE